MKFTTLAQENIDETGCDPQEDVEAIRSGSHTRETLLAHCLDGAEQDRVGGWRDYVETICQEAASTVGVLPDLDGTPGDIWLPEGAVEPAR